MNNSLTDVFLDDTPTTTETATQAVAEKPNNFGDIFNGLDQTMKSFKESKLIPDGTYAVRLEKVEIKRNKDTGAEEVAARFKILDGEQGNKTIFNNFKLRKYEDPQAWNAAKVEKLYKFLASVTDGKKETGEKFFKENFKEFVQGQAESIDFGLTDVVGEITLVTKESDINGTMITWQEKEFVKSAI